MLLFIVSYLMSTVRIAGFLWTDYCFTVSSTVVYALGGDKGIEVPLLDLLSLLANPIVSSTPFKRRFKTGLNVFASFI